MLEVKQGLEFMIRQWQTLKSFQRRSASLFSDYGDLYDATKIDGKTRQVYSAFQKWGEVQGQKIIRKNNLDCKFAFGIIDDPAIRAFATKTDEGYLVGVNAGTVHYFYNYCRAIMASEFAFPYIKRPARRVEFDVDPRNTAIYSPIKQFDDHENEEVRILASNMFSFCSLFIVQHELMHIFTGHLDYYIHLGGKDLMDAPLGLLNQGLPRRDAQAMEFWADGLSFYKYMTFAIGRAMSVPAWPIADWFAQGNSEVPAGPFSAYAVFRALASIDRRYDPATSSHPPTYMRARNLQLIASKALQKTDVPQAAAVRDFIETPMRWAFEAYNDIAGKSDGSFDDLVQGNDCLKQTSDLLSAAETLYQSNWKQYALIRPEGTKELIFGAGN